MWRNWPFFRKLEILTVFWLKNVLNDNFLIFWHHHCFQRIEIHMIWYINRPISKIYFWPFITKLGSFNWKVRTSDSRYRKMDFNTVLRMVMGKQNQVSTMTFHKWVQNDSPYYIGSGRRVHCFLLRWKERKGSVKSVLGSASDKVLARNVPGC